MENEKTINIGEVKEAEKEPLFEIEKREHITGQMSNGYPFGLPDWWLDKIDEILDKMNTDFVYIRETKNHIEIGPANVNCIM